MIDAIARHADISKAAAGRALDATVGAIKTSLRKGDIVTLVGLRLVLRRQAQPARRPQSAHRRRDQDQGRQGAEVPRWKSAEGCAKLARFTALRAAGSYGPREVGALSHRVSGWLARIASFVRVLSSAGRASPLQGECRRFDPVSTHQHPARERDANAAKPSRESAIEIGSGSSVG